mmetsp:Transcript_60725/g.98325  ORF Transcript_60725/g.98325 Transcript_60725/m.98325 type:complete len:284 (+) Transcript_60725:1075-1926(+)
MLHHTRDMGQRRERAQGLGLPRPRRLRLFLQVLPVSGANVGHLIAYPQLLHRHLAFGVALGLVGRRLLEARPCQDAQRLERRPTQLMHQKRHTADRSHRGEAATEGVSLLLRPFSAQGIGEQERLYRKYAPPHLSNHFVVQLLRCARQVVVCARVPCLGGIARQGRQEMVYIGREVQELQHVGGEGNKRHTRGQFLEHLRNHHAARRHLPQHLRRKKLALHLVRRTRLRDRHRRKEELAALGLEAAQQLPIDWTAHIQASLYLIYLLLCLQDNPMIEVHQRLH